MFYILTQLLATYIDVAFAKMYIQYPFVATTMHNQITERKKREFMK